jgi:hypothetical protein
MKSITLFLPDTTHETLNHAAKITGIELAHFCSNILTDFAASGRFPEEADKTRNGNVNQIFKAKDASKPDKVIHEMQLVEEIVMFLRKKGGKAEKVIVEEAVFEKNKSEFSKPFWQIPVGGDVPRWKKNTQFARNTARKMDLIKTPEESGHGIWALTEKGWKWKFE